LMWRYVSLRRDENGLLEARRQLETLRADLLRADPVLNPPPAARIAWREMVNILKIAELVIAAALQRRESRGSHWRGDYPRTDEQSAGMHYVFYPALVQPVRIRELQEATPHA